MHDRVKKLVFDAIGKFDIGIERLGRLEQLRASDGASRDLALLTQLPQSHGGRLLKLLRSSKSQLRQDLFVLSTTGFKTGGYFVEFGATNGVDLSNTHLLESEFGWTGILAEPGKRWHSALKLNRSCHVETDCIWRKSNSVLTFNETEIGEYSTLDAFSSSWVKKHSQSYEVKTISLEDLLEKYGAPREIDYMSIDTEGSEFEILAAFNFEKYRFRILTVEHNFGPTREAVLNLLSRNGYVRKFEDLTSIDDWYVRSDWSEALLAT